MALGNTQQGAFTNNKDEKMVAGAKVEMLECSILIFF